MGARLVCYCWSLRRFNFFRLLVADYYMVASLGLYHKGHTILILTELTVNLFHAVGHSSCMSANHGARGLSQPLVGLSKRAQTLGFPLLYLLSCRKKFLIVRKMR